MSRAFVKEPDGDQAEDDVVEKPQSGLPNYITTAGLLHLKETLEGKRKSFESLKADADGLQTKNEVKRLEADIRYLEKRIQSAIPVDTAKLDQDDIRFGALVNLEDEDGRKYQFRIVGEDEADVDKGLLSWASPLARELIGKTSGDTLVWKRPSGEIELEILSFKYQ